MVERHSSLDGIHRADPAPEAAVRLAEWPHRGKLNLRGDPADPGFLEAVAGVIGVPLPVDPGTAAESAGATVLWLGPDEWLLVQPADAGGDLAERLGQALAGRHAALTDVGDARTTLRLSGRRARDLLAKGCALDLHPTVFAAGRVAQGLVAHADVILHRLADEPGGDPVFDLYVARSFAPYLWAWLTDAGMEFGLVPAP